jgi:outer membrane protein TolC
MEPGRAADLRVRRRRFGGAVVFFAGLLAAGSAAAQEADQPPAVALSFQAAASRFEHESPALTGSDHAVAAARETAAAVKTLHRPLVTASAQYLEYQKTLSVDLAGPKQNALDSTQDFLSALPGTFPPAFQDIATEITGKLSQALPGLFAAIPDSLSYRYRDDVFRPTVQAVMPIYTGGAIPAIQHGAAAGVSLAEAKADQARDAARINLIRVYFGQLAAQSLEDSARQSRDALAKLYDDSRKFEAEGVTPRARTLEAEVARDTAERAYQRAVLAHRTARDELAQVLDLAAVRPTTPLFVQSRPLAPVVAFLGHEGRLPQSRQAEAASGLAKAGVDLAKARYRPQVFAFGEYNLDRHEALPTEPDWIVGVGARITLLSNISRGHALAAAREQQAAAADAAREARKTATTTTTRAWDLTESARRSFLLLDSSIAAATENLRVQRVSFEEGETTVTAVLGAEAALATARAQRIATAYEYDLALAGLLATSDQLDAFSDYLAHADIRIAPEPAP